MLTDRNIKDEVYLSSAYSNGCQYFRWGYVKGLEYDEDSETFHATVKGSRNYRVSVEVDEDGDIGNYACTCPAFYEYDGACKHAVATMKAPWEV